MSRSSRQIVDLSFDAQALMRGRASEDRIEKVLEQMVETGEIAFFYRAEVDGELDRRGIDFQVYPDPNWSIDLQVKSSVGGKMAHIAEYGPSIACVVVHDAMDDRQLLNEMRRELGLSIEGIIKHH